MGRTHAALRGELTRADGEEFLALASQIPIRTEVETHPLEGANAALGRLRAYDGGAPRWWCPDSALGLGG